VACRRAVGSNTLVNGLRVSNKIRVRPIPRQLAADATLAPSNELFSKP